MNANSEYIFPSILITDRHTEIRLDQLLFGHLVYSPCKCGKDGVVSVLCAFEFEMRELQLMGS